MEYQSKIIIESLNRNIKQGDEVTTPFYSAVLGAYMQGLNDQGSNPIVNESYTNTNNETNVPTQTNESESVRAYTYLHARSNIRDYRTISAPDILSEENDKEIMKTIKELDYAKNQIKIRTIFGKTFETEKGQIYVLGQQGIENSQKTFQALVFQEKDFDKIKPYIADFLDKNSPLSDHVDGVYERIKTSAEEKVKDSYSRAEDHIDRIGRNFFYRLELKHQKKENSTHEYSPLEEEAMYILNNWNKPTMPQFNTARETEWADPEFDGLF